MPGHTLEPRMPGQTLERGVSNRRDYRKGVLQLICGCLRDPRSLS